MPCDKRDPVRCVEVKLICSYGTVRPVRNKMTGLRIIRTKEVVVLVLVHNTISIVNTRCRFFGSPAIKKLEGTPGVQSNQTYLTVPLSDRWNVPESLNQVSHESTKQRYKTRFCYVTRLHCN